MYKILNIISLVIFLNITSSVISQERNMLWKGNQSYSGREYEQAELSYRESLNLSPTEDALFNLGNSLYKQEKYEEASKIFGEIANTTEDKLYRAEAFHNQGNAYLKSQKIDQGIEAYKNSLRNNPNDEETRYNLSYAMKLKEEQENQEQNQDQQNQDQQNQDQQNQDQQNQDQQNQDQQNQDQQKQDQQQDQQQKEQENQQNKPEETPRPNEISKQDAERMLKNLENEEEKTQEKVKLEQRKSSNTKIENDW